MRFYHIIASLFMLSALAACSSQPDYRAATANGYGYSEQKITDNYYRVSFKARGENINEARAYALRRASELTAVQGYDWFVVLQNDSTTERQQDNSHLETSYGRTTVQDCGLLTCRNRTVHQPDSSIGVQSRRAGQVEVALEIRMGKGVKPEGANVYPVVTA